MHAHNDIMIIGANYNTKTQDISISRKQKFHSQQKKAQRKAECTIHYILFF